MGDESSGNQLAINRLKSMFEGGTKPDLKSVKPQLPKKSPVISQNGDVPKTPTEKQANGSGAPKRNSLSIPDAFKADFSGNKSPVGTNNPKPVLSKFAAAKDLENKVSSDSDSKPKPPWMKKQDNKPPPPWMKKQTSSDGENVPSWKQKQESVDSDSVKPVPSWKQKQTGNKPAPPARKPETSLSESDKKPTPPAKVFNSPSQEGKSSENSVASRWNKKEVGKTDSSTDKPSSSASNTASESSEVISFKPSMLRKGSGSGFGLSLLDIHSAKKSLSPMSPTAKGFPGGSENQTESVPVRPKPLQMRGNQFKKQVSIKRKSLTRTLDDKKFYEKSVDIDIDDLPPPKPPKLSGFVDLESIISEYKASLKQNDKDDSESQNVVEYEEEELYEELPEQPEDVPLRSTPKKLGRAVSIIKPMTEEEEDEEYEDTANTMITSDASSGPPLPPLPRTGAPPKPLPPTPPTRSAEPDPPPMDTAGDDQDDAEADELYEPLDDIPVPSSTPAPPVEEPTKKEEKKVEEEKLDKKAKEKLEKEKREKEQKRQKEEKKRKAEEEKRFKLWKKTFNVSRMDIEQNQGEGVIKNDDKGSGRHNLEVKKDELVQIIRMIDNPAGKWLVKHNDSEKLGYVDSSNVRIDNNLIKYVMEGSYMNTMNLPPPPDDLLQDDVYDDAMTEEPVQEDYYEDV